MKRIFLSLMLLNFNVVCADSLNCPCKVVDVLEGDSVQVLDRSGIGYEIRLSGIDAPERKQALAKKSVQNLASKIAGLSIEVEYSEHDHYRRIVGKLLRHGQDINLQQIKDGYAWYDKWNQQELSKLERVLYSSAEIESRKKRIGLWAVPAIPPWEFRRKR